jgi:hypothetical protein
MTNSTKIKALLRVARMLLLIFVCRHNDHPSNYAVDAKHVSGDFRLSGLSPAYELTTFAVVPLGATLNITLSSVQPYYDERFLHLSLYRDVEWKNVASKLILCNEQNQHTRYRQPIKLVKDVASAMYISKLEFDIQSTFDNKEMLRSHYWYIKIDDCSLEQVMRDARVPKIHFELDIRNKLPTRNLSNNKKQPGMIANNKYHHGKFVAFQSPAASASYTHLSADEMQFTLLHTITFTLSFGVVVFLLYQIGTVLFTSNKLTIHLALLWVAVVAACDALASLCEIIHLRMYHINGIGSYAIDAMAAHCEAVCDSLLIILQLMLASGWTLPSDVVIPYNPSTDSPIHKFISQFRSLVSNVITAKDGINIGTVLGIFILAMHVICAQWGRIYNDDFESYHDYAHLPGQITMIIRTTTGLLVVMAALQTRLKCKVQSLQMFYLRFAWLSTLWCQTLPALVAICNTMIPYYLRQPAVVFGSALLQTSCIVGMTWLVTSHSGAYHQFSHVTSQKGFNTGKGSERFNEGTSLTESLQNASILGSVSRHGSRSGGMWTTKIRAD